MQASKVCCSFRTTTTPTRGCTRKATRTLCSPQQWTRALFNRAAAPTVRHGARHATVIAVVAKAAASAWAAPLLRHHRAHVRLRRIRRWRREGRCRPRPCRTGALSTRRSGVRVSCGAMSKPGKLTVCESVPVSPAPGVPGSLAAMRPTAPLPCRLPGRRCRRRAQRPRPSFSPADVMPPHRLCPARGAAASVEEAWRRRGRRAPLRRAERNAWDDSS